MNERPNNSHPLEAMRTRADQVRRLVRMTNDPELALNLWCCAQGLEADIDRLATDLNGDQREQSNNPAANAA